MEISKIQGPSFAGRLYRLNWFIIAMLIRPFVKIRKKRVCCWSYYYTQYSCNPMYITKYLLEQTTEKWDIYWVLFKANDINVDERIKIVRPYSLRYIYALYSSEYIFNNCRLNKFGDFFVKKKGQKYIMTWHGSTPLKKIEGDAGDNLPNLYHNYAKRDSKICDLMLSNCEYFTKIIRRAFYYNGEILEKGVPRNDIFFNNELREKIKMSIMEKYHIEENTLIVMYAPTFRTDNNIDYLNLNWQIIINAFKKKFCTEVAFFVRLHPNTLKMLKNTNIFEDKSILNMCYYPDMQELLSAADVLITDYSSTMFEMGLQQKLCLLYAPDIDKYDRGFYFNLHELPFPLMESEKELIKGIECLDFNKYKAVLASFNSHNLKNFDNGHACKALHEWMVQNEIS